MLQHISNTYWYKYGEAENYGELRTIVLRYRINAVS